jgi:hypothetical protein
MSIWLIIFPIQNGIEHKVVYRYCFSAWHWKEHQVGQKLSWAHQLLDYADDVNLQGDNTDTMKEIT